MQKKGLGIVNVSSKRKIILTMNLKLVVYQMIFLSNIEKKTYLIYLDHSGLTCETCEDKFINRNVIHEKYNDKKKI